MGTDNHDSVPNTPSQSELEIAPNPENSIGGSENSSEDRHSPRSEPEDGTAEAPLQLEGSLAAMHAILGNRMSWAEYIQNHPNLSAVRTALRLVYKYHPLNDGKNPNFPKATLGDIHEMRSDLMEASALSVYMAAQAGGFIEAAVAMDHKRKLVRDSVAKRILQEIAAGHSKWEGLRLTQKDREAEGRIESARYIQLMGEYAIIGRILDWCRASLRDFVNSLQVVIPSTMREEKKDAKLR